MIETIMGKNWKVYEDLPRNDMMTFFFIDFMDFIQKFQNLRCSTFKELSKIYLDTIFQIRPKQCNIVHIIGNRYDKAEERL